MSSSSRPGCVSDLRLDQLLVGELPEQMLQAVEAHLAGCPACAQRYDEFAADRADFAARAPAFEALLAPARRTRAWTPLTSRRWLARLALPAAAVVALGIGFSSLLRERPAPSLPVVLETTRTKGAGAAFGFVVRRGEHNVAGEDGEVLHPGDALRFTLSSGTDVYAAVWGIDSLGHASLYQRSPELAFVPAGRRQPLPEAVELDETLGQERLVAVFCATPRAASEITAALTSADPPRLPAGCGSESIAILKALP
jgi:hypothetical protein